MKFDKAKVISSAQLRGVTGVKRRTLDTMVEIEKEEHRKKEGKKWVPQKKGLMSGNVLVGVCERIKTWYMQTL